MIQKSTPTLLGTAGEYPLHQLGWKAFQDLAIAIAEECLKRPVQKFFEANDAGRDGAFIGRWDIAGEAGESTIQCKFTSQPGKHLSLALLRDELKKVKLLAQKGLADDYIILTNHRITGANDLKIKAAFQKAGVKTCRVFGYEWIADQIKSSARLRMMVPRLYGLGNLNDLLDDRAYAQAQMILSAMGDDLRKLVLTDAYRQSVKAIDNYNLVLLLGAPAAGKSTIGAGLALGAVDRWQCQPIRATSPEDIQRHLNAGTQQFFWIDDAWGSTQFQRHHTEAWNQIFPLMQSAMKSGARFLITSRDYIWESAKKELKLQAFPLLNKSQVVINVEDFSPQEKAQILYNHLKMGDQPLTFRSAVKPYLPEIAESENFLPEVARRFGTAIFTENVYVTRDWAIKFFNHPKKFLLETITNLPEDCHAAIAVIFMNGGTIASPVEDQHLEAAAKAFGSTVAATRKQMEALNGSLLLFAHDEKGSYWTYKHPTIADAFARYVAASPELVEIYLKGAKPRVIVREVVCNGNYVSGASVVVPDPLQALLAERLLSLESYDLGPFLCYRSNRKFIELMLDKRPDIFERLTNFFSPIAEDSDAHLLARLHELNLLPEEIRENFVETVRINAMEEIDASFLSDDEIKNVLTDEEKASILQQVETEVLGRIPYHIERLRDKWNGDTDPEDYFDEFKRSIDLFMQESASVIIPNPYIEAQNILRSTIEEMNEQYEPPSSTSTPSASPLSSNTSLLSLFSDVDE